MKFFLCFFFVVVVVNFKCHYFKFIHSLLVLNYLEQNPVSASHCISYKSQSSLEEEVPRILVLGMNER